MTATDEPTDGPGEPDMRGRIDLGLARIQRLVKHLGDPQLAVPTIHVAGTNGKGSVCAYLDSILRQAGFRTARFNSPHLVHVRDSISLDGAAVPDALYQQSRRNVEEVDRAAGIGASNFELLTATAFNLFRSATPPIDCSIIEVGMGGSTDATNVIERPLVSVITAIDLDHVAFLGDTVEQIASHKAGILKKGSPAVLGPQKHAAVVETVRGVACALGCPLVEVVATLAEPLNIGTEKFTVPLAGSFQSDNALTAIETIKVLRRHHPAQYGRVTDLQVAQGIEQTRWPGRLETVEVDVRDRQRRVLVDGAHNASAAVALRDHLAAHAGPTTYIIALSAPRDPVHILRHLLPCDTANVRILATTFSPPDEMPWVKPIEANAIVEAVRSIDPSIEVTAAEGGIKGALEEAFDEGVPRVVVAGSLYLVADLFRYQQGKG